MWLIPRNTIMGVVVVVVVVVVGAAATTISFLLGLVMCGLGT